MWKCNKNIQCPFKFWKYKNTILFDKCFRLSIFFDQIDFFFCTSIINDYLIIYWIIKIDYIVDACSLDLIIYF